MTCSLSSGVRQWLGSPVLRAVEADLPNDRRKERTRSSLPTDYSRELEATSGAAVESGYSETAVARNAGNQPFPGRWPILPLGVPDAALILICVGFTRAGFDRRVGCILRLPLTWRAFRPGVVLQCG